ncbi:MAG TPA: hypothetical protein VF384_08175 [Planctomycetota bacterium]
MTALPPSDAAPPPARRASSIAAHLGWGGYALALALALVVPVIAVPIVSLDRSWYALLCHAWRNGLQAGRDFVFTYGPLGGPLTLSQGFDPDSCTMQLVCSYAASCAIAVTWTSLLRQIPGWTGRVAGALLLLYLTPMLPEMYLSTIVAGTAIVLYRGDGSRLRTLAVVTLLAAFGMVKFTGFVLAALCVAVMTVVAWRRTSRRAAAVVAGGYAGAFVLLWLGAGQELGGLPGWLRASSEVSSGYNDVMGCPGPDSELGLAVAAMLLLGSLAAWLAIGGPRRPVHVGIAIATLATGFVAWKGGLVQHDSGHVRLFFQVIACLQLALLPALAEKVRGRRLASGLALAVIALAVFALEHARDEDIMPSTPAVLRWRWSTNLENLFSLREFVDTQLAEWERLAAETPMPETRRELGSGSIDAFGHTQGILFTNRLRIRHRPVFQSYQTCTPFLQEMNAACYESPDGPDHVLFQLHPINDYYPTVADSQALLALLAGYRPVIMERDFLLLRRQAVPRRRADVPSQLVLDRKVQIGEWVELAALPGDVRLLGLDLGYSLIGRMQSFLLRPPRLHLEVRLGDGQVAHYRVAPAIAQAPFLLDPLVRSHEEFLSMYGGDSLPRVQAFRVVPSEGKASRVAAEVGVRVFACDGLRRAPAQVTDEERAVVDRCRYPMFATAPFHVSTGTRAQVMVVEGRQVLFAHAPSELRFRLPAGRHAVSGRFGMLPDATKGDNQSDGVAFCIVRESGAERIRVHERLLQPGTVAGDRGMQHFRIEVESAADSVLVFLAEAGPRQDNRWDWSYWSDIRIERN